MNTFPGKITFEGKLQDYPLLGKINLVDVETGEVLLHAGEEIEKSRIKILGREVKIYNDEFVGK